VNIFAKIRLISKIKIRNISTNNGKNEKKHMSYEFEKDVEKIYCKRSKVDDTGMK